MPRHSRADLANALRRRFSVYGDAGFDTISPEIVPIVLVDDLRQEPFGSWRPAMHGTTQAGVAGQYSYIQLYNPAGSLTQLYVEYVVAVTTVAGLVRLAHGATELGVTDPVRFRDSRTRGRPVAHVNPATNASLAINAQVGRWVAPANHPVLMPIEYTLEPGEGLSVNWEVVNAALTGMFFWRERTRSAERDVS